MGFPDIGHNTVLLGFLRAVGLASGVSEGIQKLGRLWLELAAVAALDNSPGLLCVPSFSLPMFLPEKKKKAVLTELYSL